MVLRNDVAVIPHIILYLHAELFYAKHLYEANGFLYLITVSENVIEKSTIAVKEILHNDENYIVISDADSLVTVPKSISEFIISYETNIVNLETSAGTITKATFCITKEMQDKIQ